MKNNTTLFLIGLLVLALGLAGCDGAVATQTAVVQTLVLKAGEAEQTFTLEALQELPQTTVSLDGTDYVGVTLPALLDAAGIDGSEVSGINAVATDGFAASYEPALFQREDVILAYGLAGGAMAPEDGGLRMVVPGEAGRLNVRMVAEIEVVR